MHQASIQRKLIAAVEDLEPRLLFSSALAAAPRSPPAITSGNSAVFVAGTPGTFTVSATASPTAVLREGGKLPSGIAFRDAGDGTAQIFGTPALNAGGVYSIAFSAANGVAPNVLQRFSLTVDQQPTITSAKHLTASTLLAARFVVTTAGYPAAAISETGILPPGFIFTDNGNGTAVLTDAAGGVFHPATLGIGVYTLTFAASNGFAPDAAQVFTLTVNEPPRITSGNLADFTTDAPGTFTVTTAGYPNAMLTERGVLPSGLAVVDNGDGTATLFGTPAHTAGGSYSILLTAANGVLPAASQRFTIIIDQPPVFTSANQAILATGHVGGLIVKSAGYPAALIDITGAGTLPAGITIKNNSNGTASLVGVPAVGDGGIYVVTLRANNGVTPIATQVFTLMVDQPPVFTSLGHTAFTTDSPGTFSVIAGGFPAAEITEIGTLPSGLVFIDNGDATATLIGTPSADAGGRYNLKFLADGPFGAAVQAFTLTVAEPTAITSADTTTFTIGHPLNFTVTTSGFPAPSISESGSLPNIIGLRDNGNGTASFFGKLLAGTAGTYTLTLTADNHNGSVSSQIFTLIVGA